jgi:hypothetical protein
VGLFAFKGLSTNQNQKGNKMNEKLPILIAIIIVLGLGTLAIIEATRPHPPRTITMYTVEGKVLRQWTSEGVVRVTSDGVIFEDIETGQDIKVRGSNVVVEYK